MEKEACIRLANLDVEDPVVDDKLASEFDDVLFSGFGGAVMVSVFADSDDLVSSVVDVAKRLGSSFPDVKVVGVEYDYVGVTDIAHRVGVSREGARKWVRDGTFPSARSRVRSASMDLWVWSEVAEWLKEHREIDMEENLPTYAEMIRIENALERNGGFSTGPWHEVLPSGVNRRVSVQPESYSQTVSVPNLDGAGASRSPHGIAV